MAQGQNRLPSSQLLAAQEKKKLHDCLCSSAAVGGEERSHGCFCEEANATYWRLLAATARKCGWWWCAATAGVGKRKGAGVREEGRRRERRRRRGRE